MTAKKVVKKEPVIVKEKVVEEEMIPLSLARKAFYDSTGYMIEGRWMENAFEKCISRFKR